MENLALIDSFSEFKDDKLIDRVTLMAILEDVFRNALKKKFGSDDNFDIIIKVIWKYGKEGLSLPMMM
jgi:N utilization substance protein A